MSEYRYCESRNIRVDTQVCDHNLEIEKCKREKDICTCTEGKVVTRAEQVAVAKFMKRLDRRLKDEEQQDEEKRIDEKLKASDPEGARGNNVSPGSV